MGRLILPPAGGPRRTAPGLLAGLALLLGASACTQAPGDAHTPAAARPTPSATAPAAKLRAEHIDGESVSQAPKPLDGTALISEADRSGNATLPIKGKVAEGRLAIQVTCQGEGTLTVSLTPGSLQFPLTCLDRETSSTYNEIHLKQARDGAAVQVAAPAGVRWAITVEQ
ncbi:hypothetical protein ACFTWH_34775 [Streptomyces sp. NPDC057011]|uniref:hypothetical protein n=1 Tax=unclassified Streptomyces TaxID=2593676 RepID=UPI0036370B93